jgi:hypothetical protein
MNDVHQHLLPKDFRQFPKFYIINRRKIIAIEKNSILMRDKMILILGYTYEESFGEVIMIDLVFTRRKTIRT